MKPRLPPRLRPHAASERLKRRVWLQHQMALENPQENAAEKTKALDRRDARLDGHIMLVTGGDSGIGQASAIAAAQAGAKVAVTYHSDKEGAEATKEEIEKAGQPGMFLRLDQSDPKQVQEVFKKVRAELGAPTILVNNAGVDAPGVPVKDMEPEDWDRDLSVNLSGPFYCTHAFLRTFLDEYGSLEGQQPPEDPEGWTRGVIINITSVHDRIPRAGASSYDAAKGGLKNLARTLALELGEERIRVVNVAPGMVLTPFNEPARQDEDTRHKMIQSIPMKRAGLPSEIGSVVAFLASEEASYIHGTTIYVDGGLKQFQGQGA